MPAPPSFYGALHLPYPPFVPRMPWWGGDLQTLRNTLRYRAPDFSGFPAERLALPLADGDTLLALANRPRANPNKPTVVLIHGLTGDENSRNIETSAAFHLGRGAAVVRLNLRGAGPSLGHCRGHYHAGRSEDLREALLALPAVYASAGLFLIGVSLGGNMLLKFMAEGAVPSVRAAIAVSAPIDLKRAQETIMRPRNTIYHRHLLRQMKHDAARSGDARITPNLLARVRSVYDFDDLIVAPGGGFAGADDYYARCSAAPMLDRIRHPTLLIHAADDPWIPAAVYCDRLWPSEGSLSLLLPPGGGHVGFHARGDIFPWHDRCAGMFLEAMEKSA